MSALPLIELCLQGSTFALRGAELRLRRRQLTSMPRRNGREEVLGERAGGAQQLREARVRQERRGVLDGGGQQQVVQHVAFVNKAGDQVQRKRETVSRPSAH